MAGHGQGIRRIQISGTERIYNKPAPGSIFAGAVLKTLRPYIAGKYGFSRSSNDGPGSNPGGPTIRLLEKAFAPLRARVDALPELNDLRDRPELNPKPETFATWIRDFNSDLRE